MEQDAGEAEAKGGPDRCGVSFKQKNFRRGHQRDAVGQLVPVQPRILAHTHGAHSIGVFQSYMGL